jgi:glycosyltransferase involved in cell wall biosynthesis
MRITILQGAFLPVPPIMGGAVEKIWFEMGKQFAARGHQVTHVSRSHPSLRPEEMIDGVRHLRVSGFETPRSGVWLKCLDFMYTLRAARHLPESDVIVTNTFWAPLLLNKRHGVEVISVQRMPKGQMRIYRHAERWHAVSSAVEEAILREQPSERDRIRVIPNPLPFLEQNPATMTGGGKGNLILYAGRIHPEKGLDLLISALRLPELQPWLKTWRVELAGPWSVAEGGGGESYVKSLLQSAKGLPVSFSGALHEPARLQALYRKAAVFVYPSIAEMGETFGVAPLEAMACGAVPMVSDLACFKDFIRHGENGVVFDHRAGDAPQRLADALAALLADSSLCRQLAASALRVNQTHAPGRIAEMFLNDFANLVKERKAATARLING